MTHCGGIDGLEEAFSDLGKKWHSLEITVKLYPVCHMTHSFIDCIFKLMEEEHFCAEDIESVVCRIESRCYSIVCSPREAKVRPKTDYMMRFSLPYVIAVAAITHRMGSAQIDIKYADDPKVIELMDRVECISDDTKRNPGYFPGYVQVTLKDGRCLTKDQRYETGAPQNPLNVQAVNRKFVDNLAQLYSQEQTEKILGKLSQFEKLVNAKELIDVLRT